MKNEFTRLFAGRLIKDGHLKGQMVILSLVSLIVTFSLVFVGSMTEGIERKYVVLGDGDIFVEGKLEEEMANADVEIVYHASALCYGDEKTALVQVKGVGDGYFSDERKREFQSFQVGLADTTLRKVIISKSLSENLHVDPGEKILLVLVKGEDFKPVLCVVDGLYESGYAEFDSHLVFCQDDLLETYGYLPVTEILSDDADSLKMELERKGYASTAWYEREDDLAANLKTSKQVVTSVFLIVVILAAYFVSDFASTLVNDKKREIAQLKLLGATDGSIRMPFLLASFLVSFFSLVIGMASGIILSYLTKPLLTLLSHAHIDALSYYLLSFRITIPYASLFTLISLLLVLSLLSCAWVLRRLSRIEPLLLTK